MPFLVSSCCAAGRVPRVRERTLPARHTACRPWTRYRIALVNIPNRSCIHMTSGPLKAQRGVNRERSRVGLRAVALATDDRLS
ncbi:hypothetical protein SKAU_G00308170 [Synaphobranchus kaupii]|uniref:Uncharacterized protein n=1 Tax=Synaphobranchus kaupii TaxID=118154 RepID=A0A9Q1ERB6_SYNKA|nr:hypothetical protein SKAU_G00308170 [Synaphobranchus kaupii]